MRYAWAQPNYLLSVAKEIVYEINQLSGDVEVMQLLDQQVPLYGIKGRTDVHKEYPGKVAWRIQGHRQATASSVP